MLWPEGIGRLLQLEGTARDAVTIDPADMPSVVAAAAASVGIAPGRKIVSVSSTPERANIEALIGCQGGGHLRAALDHALPGEREAGTPLYLLLDDISGCSLIAGFVVVRWPELLPPSHERPRINLEGVCIGFAPGNSSLIEQQSGAVAHRVQQVGSLINPDDPHGWHDLAELPGLSMRRARRIDVWRDGDTIVIDSAFQDSAGDPHLDRVAVHEYRLQATADAATLTLQTVTPDPRILPFRECPSAKHTAASLIGTPLANLRLAVLENLGKTNGCTHLNDALRALAEVPVLLEHLDRGLL
ncbi:unannotated protein [freshwater metagenome]|uniref:Unannotated protein n=1 Tax=freshwater metagenome TaxID=449393 RepID=A0A6J6A730_9ZZZZ